MSFGLFTARQIGRHHFAEIILSHYCAINFRRKYNGDFNPLLGLLHMKVGKIQLFKGCSKEALHNLNKASDILKVTHGEEDNLYKSELVPLLIQAAAECDCDDDD